jgi:hypothetical protein
MNEAPRTGHTTSGPPLEPDVEDLEVDVDAVDFDDDEPDEPVPDPDGIVRRSPAMIKLFDVNPFAASNADNFTP